MPRLFSTSTKYQKFHSSDMRDGVKNFFSDSSYNAQVLYGPPSKFVPCIKRALMRTALAVRLGTSRLLGWKGASAPFLLPVCFRTKSP